MRAHVLIATPEYRGMEPAARHSKRAVERDLVQNGLTFDVIETRGDSAVARARNLIVALFLRNESYTHLLQWDEDLELLTPASARAMLASGHDIVGGAYPVKDASGRVAASPLENAKIDDRGCIEVLEVGAGFLLTSRHVITELVLRTGHLRYRADTPPFAGEEMVALFGDQLVPTAVVARGFNYPKQSRIERRWLSEDYGFCHLARELGHKVHVFAPARFAHWGRRAWEGNILEAWGLVKKPEATR